MEFVAEINSSDNKTKEKYPIFKKDKDLNIYLSREYMQKVHERCFISLTISSVQFSHSVVSDSL